ncbi:MAG: prepilin-type N-terminal cleavage/methylation domain-containing protein [Deltaproteobacteria bacterium]|nr:prepilin-type N-terminal cleavage/methylation domain-containing protein [Deltaproteobacteria bacterium]
MPKTILNTRKNVRPDTQNGFTLIELLSVMVIMSVMVSVGIKKFDNLSDNAGITALQSGIRELRTRETVTWTKIKLSDTGYSNDVETYSAVDTNIGRGYNWNPGPSITGGRLHFKSQSIDLSRVKSTPTSPGSWE